MTTPEEFADNFIASNNIEDLLLDDYAVDGEGCSCVALDDAKIRAFIISIYNAGLAASEDMISGYDLVAPGYE